jgi:hypothetical protein
MLIPHERFARAYLEISESARSQGGGCTVLLLVAPDADAICAARMLAVSAHHVLVVQLAGGRAPALGRPGRPAPARHNRPVARSLPRANLRALPPQSLFRADGVEYVLTPVAGYTDVQKSILEAGESVRGVQHGRARAGPRGAAAASDGAKPRRPTPEADTPHAAPPPPPPPPPRSCAPTSC